MIIDWYTDLVEDLCERFTPEYYEADFGYSERFPSVVSLAFRYVIKYAYITLAVLWLSSFVLGAIEGTPFFQILLLSPLVAVLGAAGLVILFALLMLVESFCKILTGLILEGNVPEGAENPIDALLKFIIN